MFILGLTGSIGMGKSTTAKLFADEGVPVHDADAAVHALYEGKAAPRIEAEFPGTTEAGKVDRQKLGAAVLGNPEALKRLEAIVHPLVAEARDHFRACAAVAVGRRHGRLDERVAVHVAGGELTISWPGPGKNIWLKGPAEVSFTGSVEIDT